MFPQDLLENNKKVRPVDVKIIEHDGYIDYEIEFVELPDYYDYDYYSQDYDFGQKVEELTTTTTESSTSSNPNTPEITFVNLLKKARNKHRQIQRENAKSVPSDFRYKAFILNMILFYSILKFPDLLTFFVFCPRLPHS